MIRVPDAALLPRTPRPVRRANSAMISGEKPFGNVGNARLEHDAHHLPMAGDRVFARRRFRHPAVRADGTSRRNRGDRRGLREAFLKRDLCVLRVPGVFFFWRGAEARDAIEAEAPQGRHLERHTPRDVANRVAAPIAVRRRVGQLADADAVHDDHDRAPEGRGHAAIDARSNSRRLSAS